VIPLIGDLIKTVTGGLVQRFVTDPSKKQEAKIEIEKAMLQAVTSANKAQMEVNAQEAQHKSIFVAGWRPTTGYICAFGMAFQFIIQPLMNWVIIIIRPETPLLPQLNVGVLVTMLMGMLGLGVMRTVEKTKGVSRENDPKGR